MKIRVSNGLGKTEDEGLELGTTVQDVIDSRNLNGQTLLISVNGKIAHPSTELKEGDELELLGVIYGG
ncbi:MoaD/ThiS family protein [Candidatus Micrarchaeota archaeon]|nr:MoaD/ThiS family protein [Candidatus Micrarchaeota archaeon]MBI5177242.1 MoaD/ThiS family protein [Candidatus Micrarchaeota archaeon]